MSIDQLFLSFCKKRRQWRCDLAVVNTDQKLYAIPCTINVLSAQLKVAILTSSDNMDFGFNYQINDGFIKTQRYFNSSEIKMFELITPDIFNQTVERLIAEGYNGIVASSVEMATPTRFFATNNPQVRFLIRGSLTNTTNLSYFTYNIGINYYLTGFFAGLMTKTGKLGCVAPGLPYVPNYTCAAFLYWVSVDKSTGAANRLIDDGIDLLVNNQNDFSAEHTIMKRGGLGLGTNGYPQENIYGQHIGMSIVLDWSSVFINFVNLIVQDSPYSRKDYGDFPNNFIQISSFSFTVPEAVQKKVTDEVKRLATIPRLQHPYYCNDFNRQLADLNSTLFNPPLTGAKNNCMSNGQYFAFNTPYPGTNDRGYYSIPLTKIDVDNNLLYGFSITAGILIILSVVAIVAIYIFRNTHAIRSASPIFSMTIIFGGILTYVGVITYVLTPSNGSCNARFWFLAIGYAVMVGCMVVKNIRIWLIFDNPELRVIKITNLHLFPWVAGLVAILVVLLGLLTAPSIGNNGVTQAFGPDTDLELAAYEFQDICSMDSNGSSILLAILAVFGLLIIIGVFVSWKIRIVDIEDFNESKPIAHTLYVGLLSCFIVIPLMVSPQTRSSEQTIISAAALFITTVSMSILFIPKFLRIATGDKSSDVFNRSKSSIAASRSSKNSSNKNSGFEDDESKVAYSGKIHATFDSDAEEAKSNQTDNNPNPGSPTFSNMENINIDDEKEENEQ
ncbi:G-protein-coupled receptor family 3 protein [Heterostelium album PN500]|uniref:G-protein-coupled receptor family 3 protein n=1 Tax=Heterostelium pallidum (strain ATCC 26659 / Pp 5 / PN500) TaxID=670386 RepID=D3BI87_HETP5|nr:G-protein-coupled receptor family 3 protein [Heterostelium album PN500]EFA78987.1 G-protein-coupled receptor family 3 protein [Heterostelium album PN500]|eukprot:XP_020431111.1 G-protein-coupled receptor family 3 protein [Heterostelium album PN500]